MSRRQKIGFAVSDSSTTALSTTSAMVSLGGNVTIDPLAEAFPATFWAGWLHVQLNTISTAATIEAVICGDAAGDMPLTDAQTVTIVVGEATAADGSITVSWDLPVALFTGMTEGTLWVKLTTDAGTAVAEAVRLVWTQRG